MIGRRRQPLQGCLEFTEELYFLATQTERAYRRLDPILRAQLVNGECLERFKTLGEKIYRWAEASEYAYRHPEEWPVYMDRQEQEALARLVRGNGRYKFVRKEIAMLRRLRISHRRSDDGRSAASY